MSSRNQIELRIKGQSYQGWKSVEIQKSLEQIAGTFGLAVSDRYPQKPADWKIQMGDQCTVEIDGQVVITGYIEDFRMSFDRQQHEIQVSGRDLTGDLVDCSYVGSKNEWKNQTVRAVVEALCEPFDLIDVVVDASAATQAARKVEEFKANEGDSVSELIVKACKTRGVLVVSYGDGDLTLTQAGSKQAADTLEVGQNILSSQMTLSDKDRFSDYYVKGVGRGKKTKQLKDFVRPKGHATDEVMSRYRPLVVLGEHAMDVKTAEDRAKWELSLRAGKSRSVEYSVQGWTQSDGKVWEINTLVKVKDKVLDVNGTLLIAALRYSVDDRSGTITRLTLVDPQTYKLLSSPVMTKKGGGIAKPAFDLDTEVAQAKSK
ncbi:MAG: hypothetical protein C4575_09325 [Desulforudis sp.]|nr:MAG: hypothetical protein C4575_09325 [Desulforudis sp.]